MANVVKFRNSDYKIINKPLIFFDHAIMSRSAYCEKSIKKFIKFIAKSIVISKITVNFAT